MSLKLYYQYCVVPCCENNTKRTPAKLFINVPREQERRKQWLKLARRDWKELSPNTTMFFCEDHFDLPNDMENYMRYKIQGYIGKIRMKQGCLPSRFSYQRSRKRTVPKTDRSVMTKKRRKQLVQEAMDDAEGRGMFMARHSGATTGSPKVLHLQINPLIGPAKNLRHQETYKYRSKETADINNLSDIVTSNNQYVSCDNVKIEITVKIENEYENTESGESESEVRMKQELYAGHEVKEEMVIGPVVLQQPDACASI